MSAGLGTSATSRQRGSGSSGPPPVMNLAGALKRGTNPEYFTEFQGRQRSLYDAAAFLG